VRLPPYRELLDCYPEGRTGETEQSRGLAAVVNGDSEGLTDENAAKVVHKSIEEFLFPRSKDKDKNRQG
jgi:hypothetical protein